MRNVALYNGVQKSYRYVMFKEQHDNIKIQKCVCSICTFRQLQSFLKCSLVWYHDEWYSSGIGIVNHPLKTCADLFKYWAVATPYEHK